MAVLRTREGGLFGRRTRGPDPGEPSLAFRLARDLTEAMGDTLRTELAPGGGRGVIVCLPAAATSRK